MLRCPSKGPAPIAGELCLGKCWILAPSRSVAEDGGIRQRQGSGGGSPIESTPFGPRGSGPAAVVVEENRRIDVELGPVEEDAAPAAGGRVARDHAVAEGQVAARVDRAAAAQRISAGEGQICLAPPAMHPPG
jgi:hypothetical protein